MSEQSQLIVFSGLPMTGKTRLAEAVGRALSIPVFSDDALKEAIMENDGHKGPAPLSDTVNNILIDLAYRQFMLDQSAILDTPASDASIRDYWRRIADKQSAQWRVIECIYSDEQVYRTRIVELQADKRGWIKLEWDDVEKAKATFDQWEEDRLVVDAVQPFEDNLAKVLAYVSGKS